MKLGKYPVKRSDSKAVKSLKRKLKHIEKSLKCSLVCGFKTKKLIGARSYYIEQIKIKSK
jgi:hypothetical protein